MGDKVVSMQISKPKLLPSTEAEKLQGSSAVTTIDIYSIQCQELARIEHPDQKAPQSLQDVQGKWVYYAQKALLLHCVDEASLYKLRTNRNQMLISAEEQQALRKALVGVAGMSVGSGIAVGLSYAGISQTIKIADFDELDTSNLNRLREALYNVGRAKAELAAERIYDLDPFADVHVFADGLNENNLSRFFDEPALSLVVDEIDDFRMKVRLRQEAKKRKLPVVMFTSLGDNILIDVERYDQDPSQRPFNGMLEDDGSAIVSQKEINPDDIKRYSVQLVGAEYIPTKALQSVLEMGRTLVGRPQLYSTIAVDGGLATYLIRQILLNQGPPSGRYYVKFSSLFGLPSSDINDSPDRQAVLTRLHQ
jgi:hypothetical protein